MLLSSGKCKLKAQWDTTMYLSEWLLQKDIISYLVKMNTHTLPVGMQNGTVTLEKSLAVSLRVKYTLTI